MIEQMLFWPISEVMRLQFSARRYREVDDFGYRLGIIIAFSMLFLGFIVGMFAVSTLPLPLLVGSWIALYFVGSGLEGLIQIADSESWLSLILWLIRLIGDGLCIGFTLRFLMFPS